MEKEFDLYKDMKQRTNGEIYIGIVGPVRTGKSTFIKQFMEELVLPNIADENERTRATDELPQSAQGKTIMTTEPKFIPQEAAQIPLPDGGSVKIRLIDCVGFMVEGASGHTDENGDRMVKTPWSKEEIPFVDAARIGTRKVIRDHATIGIVVTTDGSVSKIARDNYIAPEQETIEEMHAMNKPFAIVLNCERPYGREAEALAASMREAYHAPVVAANVRQMKKEDILRLLGIVLREFPITRIDFSIPKWTEMLSDSHPVKKCLIDAASQVMAHITKMSDLKEDGIKRALAGSEENPVIRSAALESYSLSDGSAAITMSVPERYYYEYISKMCGTEIDGEYRLISLIRDLSATREVFDKIRDAMLAAQQKGYGVVLPLPSEIRMEEPELIWHGSRYGIRVKATAPSIHLIRADIETEIAPIVGSREQAEELIASLKEHDTGDGERKDASIFGKNLGDWVYDGIRTKILQMDEDCQQKLKDSMKKIVNDSSGGMICFII